jgi:hypothetical protein
VDGTHEIQSSEASARPWKGGGRVMDQPQWREEFARVQQRIQQNLEKLREHNVAMAAVIGDAERRWSRGGGSPQQ